MLYAPLAFSCFFVASDGSVAKLAGAVGAILFMAIFFVYRPSNRFVHAGLVMICIAITGALLWIPNQFWKGQTLSLERVIIVDNLADKDVIATRPIKKKRNRTNWIEQPEANANPKFVIALQTRHIESYEEVTRKTYGYVDK